MYSYHIHIIFYVISYFLCFNYLFVFVSYNYIMSNITKSKREKENRNSTLQLEII